MGKALDPAIAKGLRLLLGDHHVAIETACADLRACTYGDDALALIARYRTFERAIANHLKLEEEHILSAYSAYDPADAQAIREQHDGLWRQLNGLGLAVELHYVRATDLERLVATLRSHAEHEDQKMYPWAERHLDPTTKRHLFVQVGRSLRALARARAAFARPDAPPPPAQQPCANE